MKPNIIFIIIDAVRARNVGAYGYDKPTTPNIDKIAQEGVLFRNAYCCINYTDSSMTSIFSGIYPLGHGILRHGGGLGDEEVKAFIQSGIELLPEILQSEGYSTIALDWMGRWHRRGYDYYSGIADLKLVRAINRVLRAITPHKSLLSLRAGLTLIRRRILSTTTYAAEFTTDRAIARIKENRKKPFFLFIHYWDVHQGYTVPKRYSRPFRDMNYSEIPHHAEKVRSLYSLSDKGLRSLGMKLLSGNKRASQQIAEYDGAITYVDGEIGRLMEALKKQGIADQTLVIITSDHGESLTEHGIYFDHHGLYEVSIHVPLIMRCPGVLPGGKAVEGFVQHVDLVPTILDLLEIKHPQEDFDGESLMPLVYEGKELRSSVYVEEAYAERKMAIRTKRYQYIKAPSEESAVCRLCNRIHGGMEELYDLESDPEQNYNLVEDKPETTKAMQDLLSEWMTYLERKKARRTKAKVKDRISKLKHLGKL
jgi:arylsulfatase